jgi:transformation/transcription domain-associated protein
MFRFHLTRPQKLRSCVLEILHRLPMTADITEVVAYKIIDRLMDLIKIENEDNDILIVKTIMDLMRHNQKVMKERVQPFLDIILTMFQMMDKTVKDTFDNPAVGTPAMPATPGNQYSQSPRPSSPVSTVSAELGTEQQQSRHLQNGMQSFKVLAECPLIVVGIFTSAERGIVAKYVKEFVPQIKNTLMLQARPQERAHEEAKARGEIHTGICKEIKNRAAFGDFILMQVKTMSFLAYLLRVYSGQLTDFLQQLPDIVVRMLKDCPRERSSARKELLVAIRHIINFNFRRIFLKKLDELLDARILIGDGLTVYETMRPLAYTMLADLIHHLRDMLNPKQIGKAIQVYIKNFHDDFPGTSFQTMSAKLLINMADCIAKVKPAADARHHFMMIFNAIADKFAAMNLQFENAVRLSNLPPVPPGEMVVENYMADQDSPPEWDETYIFNATPIKTQSPRERTSNLISDNKFLLKNLVAGLKTLFGVLRNTNPTPLKAESEPSVFPANWNDLSFGFTAEEVQIFAKLFHEGIKVFRYHDPHGTISSPEAQNLSTAELLATQYMMTGTKEEKELLETFGTVFHYIDPATFHEIFHLEIPHLYNMCFIHPPLLHVAQFLLASEATSPSFCGMLLQFLMGKLDEVGVSDVRTASTLLRFFKLSFMAVTLFAAQNEHVVLPHTTKIITQAIKLSTMAEEPMNYFLLLRSLFRSIGGGKFEHIYKEILPLLEMMLDVLNSLLHTARKPQDRDLFVELSLTVPARLSNLIPHMSYLMRPIILALGSGTDLISQGLRTLELCVDNLTQDYIDPIMAPFIDELMTVLWDHLRPAPYNHYHSHTTTRILGKLGGRNRKFLTGINQLDYCPFSDDQWSYDIRLVGSTKDRAFPAHIGVDTAIRKLKENPSRLKDPVKVAAAKANDTFHKLHALRFIQSQIKLFIGVETLPENFSQIIRLQAADLLSSKYDVGNDLLLISAREQSVVKRDAQHDMLKKLIQTCHFAHSIPELKDEAASFMQSLCRHFILLEVGKAFQLYKSRALKMDIKSGEGPLFIDSRVLADAISQSLTSDLVDEREAAEATITAVWDAAEIVLGNRERGDRLPFFVQLMKNFTHNCYHEEWFTKMGGVLGVKFLLTQLPFADSWVMERYLEVIRAMMFILKDMAPDSPARPRVEAESVLEYLIPRIAKHFSKEDLEKSNTRFHVLDKSLVQDLSHSNKNARAAAQRVYQLLAETLDMDVGEIIKPVKDILLAPLFNKPLRALPFGHQIGCLDAITYCMKLESKLIPHDEPMSRLLQEVMVLLDADDENLSPKPHEFRNMDSIVQLRIGCMKLLTTAITCSLYSVPAHGQTWNKVISAFFRCLYVKSPEVVSAAHDSLRAVITVNQKLPKDLLQNGLRPILTSLQNPQKLTDDCLEGLAELLKLLTTYFKVEIGSRLIDHTKAFAEPITVQRASFSLLENNRPMRIMARLINVFHLLPPQAVLFLPQLVTKVLDLETALRRTRSSPFREPMIRYFCQYPVETWDYFAPKLQDIRHGRFLAQILAHPLATDMREHVHENSEMLLAAMAAQGSVQENSMALINTIHIVYSLSQFPETRDVLVKDTSLRRALFDAGQTIEKQLRDPQNTAPATSTTFQISQPSEMDASLRLAAEQAGEQVVAALLIFLEQELNAEFLFEFVDAVTAGRLKDGPQIYHFLYTAVIASEAVETWRSMVLKCIGHYKKSSTSQKVKAFLFHNVVNPIFAMDIQRNWSSLFNDSKGTRLLDKSMIHIINDQLWKPISNEGFEEPSVYVDHSRMELLQLTALLLKYHNHPLQDTRKDIIKFAWNWIKLEDVVNKHAAFVVIAYFIRFYETPTKIAMTVYQSLLKAHQNEGRPLVTQAMELMAPVLKKRVSADQQKLPLWARMPKKIIAEEINNLQQIICIFNFFCHQPDLFYEARDALAPTIIPHLHKVAASNNEGKRTSLNLAALIWQWEERSYREKYGDPLASPQGSKRKADGTVVSEKTFSCVPSNTLRMLLIKHLANFASILPERYPVPSAKLRADFHLPAPPPAAVSEFTRKAVHLLRSLLSPPFWSDLELDPIIIRVIKPILSVDKPKDEKKETWDTKTINTLQVLKVFVNVKSDEWIVENISDLGKYISRALKVDDPQYQDCLHSEGDDTELTPLFQRLIEALPELPTMEVDDLEETPSVQFIQSVNSFVAEALANNNFLSSINILGTMCKVRPKMVDQHIEAIMKALNTKILKDHLVFQSQQQSQASTHKDPGSSQGPSPLDLYMAELHTGLVLKVLHILASRIEVLGENRRPFLTYLATLIERSRSEPVNLKILELAESWVFNSDGIPTLKEKVAVLSKMVLYESRPEMFSLYKRYLQLILRIYEDPRVTRTELTVRLEHPFLRGTRCQDVGIRNQFLTIFDKHVSRTPNVRLESVLCGQDWTALDDSFWLSQVLHLLFGAFEMNSTIRFDKEDFHTLPLATYISGYEADARVRDVMIDDKYHGFMIEHKKFCAEIADVRLKDVMEPLQHLQHTDRDLASRIWVHLFPIFWSNMPKDDRSEFETSMASLLSKEFHFRQFDQRPNCIQTLLEGIVHTKPRVKCPPHILKFLARTYDGWYPALQYLEDAANNPLSEKSSVKESTLDALLTVYADLDESDMFYGTWRRRCQYVETNSALSYEQMGMWDQAQQMYESSQVRARMGALAFSKGEYQLWEDHWVICAQKLQQWDVLSEYAKHENFNDLFVESMWRSPEHWTNQGDREQYDSMIKSVSDAPTPRRMYFQAFMAFLKNHYTKSELHAQEFQQAIDGAIQLSIRKWHQLPKRITNSHIPLLQLFQHLVELHDAQGVTSLLSGVNISNIEQRSLDLKSMFVGWRDRLPNFWDDINAWQDLVTWRTHIFHLVNNTFQPIVSSVNQGTTANNPSQFSYAFRGYHEMAWIINRFAHVARQQHLSDVCISQLSKIYTLPNIEIQEAFIKLREQAKCHYHNKGELNNGLDVINNTNMNFFSQNQKSEFYTLKGMFLNKLGSKNEANEAFGYALYFDIRLAKAWYEWARYNDQLFKEDQDLTKAANAVSCYLEAASCYKSRKSRKLLGRVLWLLSVDSTVQVKSDGGITTSRPCTQAFSDFKSEQPYWFWITFVPQLLLGLSRPEAPIARNILLHISKQYPQALFFQLRSSREDFLQIKRTQEARELREREAKESIARADKPKPNSSSPGAVVAAHNSPKAEKTPPRPGTANSQSNGVDSGNQTPKGTAGSPMKPLDPKEQPGTPATEKVTHLKPWEHAEQIINSLKAAHPLLSWSMESMVDQITRHFKLVPDEDAHRLIVALLNDGLAYIGRQPGIYGKDHKLPTATEQNISRFAENVCPVHIRKAFEADFVRVKPTMYEYIQKLRKWRNRFEERLDRRVSPANLESMNPMLTEFRFHKLEDVEVPGQYLEHRDKNADFIRIERFLPEVHLVRGSTMAFRRVKIRGQDGSIHTFAVQTPTARFCRREERIHQLFRLFNDTLVKTREARRRNLKFNLPATVPMSPSVRIVQDDASYVTLQQIYEDWCRKNGVQKDDPVLFQIEKLKELSPVRAPPALLHRLTKQKTVEHMNAIRLDTFLAIQEKMVPSTVILDYFQATYPSFADFWLFRRTFSYQFAAATFITYIMFMNARTPAKFVVSRATGQVHAAEMIPTMGAARPLFNNVETVPFRLTPNLQMLLGPITTEGVFAPSLMAIARALTEPEGEMEMELALFVRDEVSYWYSTQRQAASHDTKLRDAVNENIDYVKKRAETLATTPDASNLPAIQTVVDLITLAVNPKMLSASEPLWMAWL